VTINDNTNNYVVTATGTTNTLQGEANLLFDGSTLTANRNITVGTTQTSNTDIRINNQTNGSIHYIFSDASTGQLGVEAGSTRGLKFNTNGANTRMTITSAGDVGIGTTSPATQLHVKASGNYGTITSDNSTTTGGGSFGVRKNGSIIGYLANKGGVYGDTTDDLCVFAETGYNFRIYTNGSATEKFIVTTGGNVGIGTTSPANKLHLNGGKFIFTSDDGSYGQLQVNAPSGGEATILLGSTGTGQNSGGYTNAGVIGIGAYGNSRDILVFGTGYSGGTMFLKNGNVGINTTSPGEKLAVSGNITVTGNLAVSTGNTTGGGIILADDGDIVDLNDGYCSMRFSLGVRVFSANRGGSAVIKLDNGGNIVSSANITAYGSPSDARKKNNIEPLQGALNIVKQLRGVTFNWNDNTDEAQYTKLKEDIGFIAQEVREIVPTIVREDTEGYLSIRDRALIPILVEAIKELNAKIDKLEGKY
jgi:hypothetical protein